MYNIYIHIYNIRYLPQILATNIIRCKNLIMFCCYVCSSVLSLSGKLVSEYVFFILPVGQLVRFGRIWYSSNFLGSKDHSKFFQLLVFQYWVGRLVEQEVLSCFLLAEARWFWLSLSVLHLPDPFLQLKDVKQNDSKSTFHHVWPGQCHFQYI